MKRMSGLLPDWSCVFCLVLFLLNARDSHAVKYVRVFPTADEEAEQSQFGRLPFDQKLAALRNLSPEKKERWRELFRWFDSDLEWRDTNQPPIYWQMPLSLGDKITAQYLVSQYRKLPDEDVLGVLGYWCAPEAVPFFVEIIEANAPAPPYGVPIKGVTIVANECFYVNVRDAYYLSKDVREWAKSRTDEVIHWNEQEFRDLDTALKEKRISYDEYIRGRDAAGAPRGLRFREMALEWWRENKTAFLAGRYDEVKPGRTMDGSPYIPVRLRPGIILPPHIPSDETNGSHHASAAVSPESETEHRELRKYCFFATMSVLLAAAIFLFRSRLRGMKSNTP